jgi:hypothetical protein
MQSNRLVIYDHEGNDVGRDYGDAAVIFLLGECRYLARRKPQTFGGGLNLNVLLDINALFPSS